MATWNVQLKDDDTWNKRKIFEKGDEGDIVDNDYSECSETKGDHKDRNETKN